MKCQILFSNNNINLSSAELAQRVVKINCTFHMYFEDTIFFVTTDKGFSQKVLFVIYAHASCVLSRVCFT